VPVGFHNLNFLQLTFFSSPDKLVTIYICEGKKPFVIHKEVAMYSPVLKAAFNRDFLEGQNQAYTLRNTTVGAFQLLVQWLYSRTFKPFLMQAFLDPIPIGMNGGKRTSFATFMKVRHRQKDLINLWVVADYLQIPGAQNLAVDELEQIWKYSDDIAYTELDYLCERVADGAPLRELVFEHCWRFLPYSTYQVCSRFFHRKMLLEYVIRDKLPKISLMPDPFTDRAAFKKRFHVPENEADSSSERSS
jgi:hypothetical protein